MIKHIHQHLYAKDIRDQDELVALFVGDVAGTAHELTGRKPFVECQVHFLAEIVHVADQTCHDLTVAWRNVL